VPTLIAWISPALISSYSFERPIPVRRHASGIRTVRAVGALGAGGRLGWEAADTWLVYIGFRARETAPSTQQASRQGIWRVIGSSAVGRERNGGFRAAKRKPDLTSPQLEKMIGAR
jgi:hypothetical protein